MLMVSHSERAHSEAHRALHTPQDDVERCGRTVYITNIDKKVDRLDVRSFFEQLCGEDRRTECTYAPAPVDSCPVGLLQQQGRCLHVALRLDPLFPLNLL
jgi:hypothetical protein